MLNRRIILFLLFISIFFVSGCARKYDINIYQTAGFFDGIWDGITVWFAFIKSWFYDDVALYDAGNNGFWYDFGYVIGLGLMFGGYGKASERYRDD